MIDQWDSEPFFVRCVNPNGIKSATEWQEWVVEGQLRCGGLVEALKVLALGYPTRVPYNTLYEKYHSTVNNPLIRNMGPESFSTALLIAFDVSEDDYELGLTKIFFKPAKAAVLETIMAQAGRPLSPEQNVKITKWVVQKRIKQLVGTCKAFLELRHRVRLTRAAKRWEHVGRISSLLAFSLCRHLRMAREQILERKRNQSALVVQSFFRGAYECSRYRKHIVKVKKATKMIWISYRRWNERRLLKSWLEQKVIETRKRKEEERIRMEEARKKELAENARRAEEERLREQARKEAEDRMEKERQRIQAEERAREEALKLEEQKRAEEEERKRKELEQEKELARQRIDRASTNVSKQKEEGERKKAAEARAERESSIKIKKKNIQKEERKRKQKREDAFMRKNFPEMVKDEEDEEEEEDDDDEDEEEKPKKKKQAKKAPKKKPKKAAKKKTKAQPEDDGDAPEPAKAEKEKGGDDDEESLQDSEEEQDEEEEDEEDEDEEEEQEEEPVLSVQQQLKTFPKTAALGQLFLKYTGRRRRKPQDRIVKVTFGENASPKQISWGSGSRHIDFDEIVYIAWGHWTPVFQSRKDQLDPTLCFNVQAQSKEMAELWVKGLRKLIGQTDEQAMKLSKQGLETENTDGGDGNQAKKADKDKGNTKEHKKRARSLMLLQQDLFVMTTTTVFRNLEEERIWDIDQSVRDKFNAKLLYEEALKEDVPWRQWNHWVRERVVAYLKENNRVTVQQPTYFQDQFVQPMNFSQPVNPVVYQPVQQMQPIQTVPMQPLFQQPIQRVNTQTFAQPQVQRPNIQGQVQGQQQDEACTLM
ncbi:hypothetical protein RFI_05576 [Reticulomyxa filosa]|uniref:Myosin motor domain-containing protein n=1 Tax=Reticulomyxa filosa TaxID=46433 RepID=X6NZX7_RETFI|nr:hypothetical protein RFI_05576 [Reticulomyxa filosa]|eukprot:ETO31546.1 hypothetical protein RFI_05576 [Reticulomyxa filosa]